MLKYPQGDVMFFVVQFIIYSLFFIFKLYSLADKFLIFSSNGTKLKKYVSDNNLLSITGSCDNAKINQIFLKFFNSIKSPEGYKVLLVKILVSLSTIAIYIALTYKSIFSNFIYINIFNKIISLNNIFGENIIVIQIIFILLFSFFIFNLVNYIFNFIIKLKSKSKSNNNFNINDNFDVCIGVNENNIDVKLKEKGLYQNVLITGSIGSGKTSSAIINILDNFIKYKFGGLIIDVKGNLIDTVYKVMEKYNQSERLKVISLDSDFVYNPLDRPNILPLEIASRLRKALELISPSSKNSDSFWLDKVEQYTKDFIVLIREYNGYASFSEIHKLVIDKNYLNEKIEYIKQKILQGIYEDEKIYELTNSINTLTLEYLKLDDRNLNIIRSEITRITAPFISNLKINQKFCSKSDNINLNDSDVIILSFNIGENKTLAKIISTYLKLDFQNIILSRKKSTNPTFFICDEYQEFANKEDANFFSVSREYKCINVISMQSYSSLINTLQDEYTSRVIIQNLVNKIWFRNDDTYTISEIIKQIGKEKKDYKTYSFSENSQESKYNPFVNKFMSYKSNLNESYSLSEKEEYILNEEYFSRQLKTFEAAMIVSDGNNIEFIKKVKLKRWEED